MSTVKIQGNVSGTGSITIAAPNTNSDLTMSLPAAGGTIASFASLTNNGVAYVNGSGQPTSGSALTFDGTNLNIGSGTNTNSAKFLVNGLAQATDNTTYQYMGLCTGGVAYSGTASNHPYAFAINGTEQMRLTSTGLGIGTSSPGQRLELASSGDVTLRLRSSAGTNDAVADITGYSTALQTGGITFSTRNAGTLAERMRLSAEGNLGLGVTPSAWRSAFKAFDIGNGSAFAAASASPNTYIMSNAYDDGAWKYKVSGYATRYQSNGSDGTHAWYTAPSGTAGNAISFTQAMTLDASGNLLLGTTTNTHSSKVVIQGDAATVNSGVDGSFATAFSALFSANNNERNVIQTAVSSGGTGSGFRFRASLGGGSTSTYPVLDLTRDQTIFYTSNTERARIDSSGNLLVGTTSQYGSGKVCVPYSSSAFGIVLQSTTAASANYAIEFKNSSGSGVGSISASTTTTTYATSSDYRLKNTIAPMTGALAKVAQLKPVTYKWKADGSDGEGFIAHELAEIVPQCVTGEKDAVDAEGNPVYQGIDTSFLVATLTAAIQELNAKVDAQAAEIAALKGTV